MNIQRFTIKKLAVLSTSILVMVGLAGCRFNQVAIVEPDLVEAGVEENDTVETGLDEIATTQVENEPTPIPGTFIYTNVTYGFKFDYPGTWTLTEEDHGAVLKKGTSRLLIRFRWADENVPDFVPSGLPAGDLLYSDKIRFLNQIIPAEALSYEGKVKKVLYGATGYVEVDNQVFLIVLEDLETGYLVVELAEETMSEAKVILESFMWIAAENESDVIGDQTIEQQDGMDGSRFWEEMEDPHYSVRFAVPCFWSVDFPKEYHGGIGAYPIRNYTEDYARSFGKREDGVWERGGIKIDMNFISGDVFGIPPGVSLQDFAAKLTDANPEGELVSTEELTINHQVSLLVASESIFGMGQFYLFHVAEDIYLMFSPIRGTINNPDVQAILNSLAIGKEFAVAVPEIIPGNPPEGIDATCMEPQP